MRKNMYYDRFGFGGTSDKNTSYNLSNQILSKSDSFESQLKSLLDKYYTNDENPSDYLIKMINYFKEKITTNDKNVQKDSLDCDPSFFPF